jgi:hypothetical protein
MESKKFAECLVEHIIRRHLWIFLNDMDLVNRQAYGKEFMSNDNSLWIYFQNIILVKFSIILC